MMLLCFGAEKGGLRAFKVKRWDIIGGEEAAEWDAQDNSSAHDEKIYVAVRVRPLSDKEIAKNDLSDWECINNTTIIFKNSLQERSLLPSAYTFDRVFGFNSPTKHVYEEAAKKISLSVLSGINSTIFAYGQTGSGKTFTMRGITECAIADIYEYIDKHCERKFVLKFSAMEIYNEAVRDLLRSDNTSLRLLDDPERGTVVDKLTEVTLKDLRQLKELLSICEAQRQIGETSLNELSSRSHQILRLTVESEALHYLGAQCSSTLTASVNFVDLAGSERASQTLSAGTRLKEGCHINRSLLSLGTVIRKLSKGRNGHIPYRDSKLTRILQNALGGNARTAIICTMSPAHSHGEQSRNTLHFANCAKQVSTNAQVNVVMSEKALVKQLQKELARMESELKNIQSLSHSGAPKSALKEKELLIQKMDQEIRELKNQRDMAQSRVEDMLRSGSENQSSKSWSYVQNSDRGSWTDEYSASEASEVMDPHRLDVVSRASNSGRYEGFVATKTDDQFGNEEQFLFNNMSPRLDIDKYFGPDPCRGWEKMAQAMEIDPTRRNSFSRNSISRNTISRNSFSSASSPRNNVYSPRNNASSPRNNASSPRITGRSLSSSDFGGSDLSPKTDRTRNCEAILASVMKSTGREVVKENEKKNPLIEATNQEKLSGPKTLAALMRENSIRLSDARMQSINDSLCRDSSGRFSDAKAQSNNSDALSRQNSGRPSDVKTQSNSVALSRQNSRSSVTNKSLREEQIIGSPSRQLVEKKQEVTLKEVNIKPNKTVKHTDHDLEKPEESAEGKSKKEKTSSCSEETAAVKPKKEKKVSYPEESGEGKTKKEKTKKERRSSCPEEVAPSKGKTKETEQSASSGADWKIEFERRKREIIELWDACHIPLVHRSYFCLLFKGDPSDAVYMEVEHRRLSFLKAEGNTTKDEAPSSPKALHREREMLSRRMLKKLSTKEREALFQKWGIEVKSKQRRLQLCRKLWTDTTNMEHINESAAIVAKLAGLKEAGKAPKEMFGLSLVPKQTNSKSFSWRHPIPSII
ncbi:ATP binding microtubule motor family protein [Perilla frutescens var. hirtella]|uniref:ATP binding microtubule motor family protein n=1 Tax=Perilla frutescens var. hirtella TaxID=608512 RepID=A0AAD4JDY7_PERFH|nr:ATP binding microtubule motor family protein [Perilla frutescens var. hirtella]